MPTTSQPISSDDAVASVIFRRQPYPATGLAVEITRTAAVSPRTLLELLRGLTVRFRNDAGTPAGDPVIIDGREALGAVLVRPGESDTAEVTAFTAGLPHGQLADELQKIVEELEVELAEDEEQPTPPSPPVSRAEERAAVEDLPRYREDEVGERGTG
ncbi:hypothetical protein ACWD2L_00710 [Streptomyces sp. NPDC002754]